MEAAENRRQSAPRARHLHCCVVGNSHGFVAAARSDCFASSEASQKRRPSSIANAMQRKYIIFMRHRVRHRRMRDCSENRMTKDGTLSCPCSPKQGVSCARRLVGRSSLRLGRRTGGPPHEATGWHRCHFHALPGAPQAHARLLPRASRD